MRTKLLAALLAFIVVVLAGCQATSNVALKVNRNGSGSVVVTADFDKEAAAALPTFREQFRTDDLEARGWKVSTIEKPPKTEVARRLVIRYDFGSIDEANVALRQLSSSQGPFAAFTLQQKRSFASVSTEFSGVIDLQRGAETFGSKELNEKTGMPLGYNADELRKSFGFELDRVLRISVTVHLPGGNDEVSPETNADGSWTGVYGKTIAISAKSHAFYGGPKVLILLGVLAILAVGVVMVLWQPASHRSGLRRARIKKDVTPGL